MHVTSMLKSVHTEDCAGQALSCDSYCLCTVGRLVWGAMLLNSEDRLLVAATHAGMFRDMLCLQCEWSISLWSHAYGFSCTVNAWLHPSAGPG
jgi:hypothetical protein